MSVAGVVRVLKPDGSTAGTGFLVGTAARTIATCAHVVDEHVDVVDVVFAGTAVRRRARLDRYAAAQDVAFLELDEDAPDGATPLPLGPVTTPKGIASTFGYP